MEHIKYIDDLSINSTIIESADGYTYVVVSKPIEAYGLLKWKIRIIKAIAILLGKADAIKYKKQYKAGASL